MGRIAEIFDVWVGDNQILEQLKRIIAYEYDKIAADRDTLRVKLGEVERERDEAVKIINASTGDLGFPTRQQMRIRTAASEYRAETAESTLAIIKTALGDAGMGDESVVGRGKEFVKEIAVQFFYHWHNSPGSNTEQGFDEWWATHHTKEKDHE